MTTRLIIRNRRCPTFAARCAPSCDADDCAVDGAFVRGVRVAPRLPSRRARSGRRASGARPLLRAARSFAAVAPSQRVARTGTTRSCANMHFFALIMWGLARCRPDERHLVAARRFARCIEATRRLVRRHGVRPCLRAGRRVGSGKGGRGRCDGCCSDGRGTPAHGPRRTAPCTPRRRRDADACTHVRATSRSPTWECIFAFSFLRSRDITSPYIYVCSKGACDAPLIEARARAGGPITHAAVRPGHPRGDGVHRPARM